MAFKNTIENHGREKNLDTVFYRDETNFTRWRITAQFNRFFAIILKAAWD